MPRRWFRIILLIFVLLFCALIVFEVVALWEEDEEAEERIVDHPGPNEATVNFPESLQDPQEPVVLWWDSFTNQPGRARYCGSDRCFFTADARYINRSTTQAVMFYGTDTNLRRMPVPRSPHVLWALLHEESPKNNYIFSHESVVTLFNLTSTFKRESHFPIPTMYLESLDKLTSRKLHVSTREKRAAAKKEGLAPVVYLHSDCNVPSGRDELVKSLQQYIDVDSYGACINNRQLPEHLRNPVDSMDHEDLYRLLARYKFALSFENALCDDYMTEKLWRPLELGVVPVVLGSSKSKLQDYLPTNQSAIFVQDFKTPRELAEFLKRLNEDDDAYDAYLRHKTSSGITNKRLIEEVKARQWTPRNGGPIEEGFIWHYECFVCNKVHELRRNPGVRYQASVSHYGCPGPARWSSDDMSQVEPHEEWMWEFDRSYCQGQVFREYLSELGLVDDATTFNARSDECATARSKRRLRGELKLR